MNTTAEKEFQQVAVKLTLEELQELDRRVLSGHIDGETWRGECACFYGTVGMLRGALGFWNDLDDFSKFRDELRDTEERGPMYETPLEWQVSLILEEDTPETNPNSAWLHGLLAAEITRREAVQHA